MSKILKNTTGAIISLDVGDSISANGQLTINPQDYDEYAASDDIVTLVGNATVVVNDGNSDLTITDGIRLIQGGFTNKIQLDDDLLSSERIKIDVAGSLSMGSGEVKVTTNDTTSSFLDDAVNVGSSKLTKTILNPGADEQLQLDVNSANINSSEINNDQGFITSAQAPVQAGDIANFETTSQLNTRDINNRNRANHTGTQTSSTISDFNSAASSVAPVQSVNGEIGVVIVDKTDIGLGNVPDVDATQRSNHSGTQTSSTISDFTSAVQTAETNTTLTFNSGTNILTYTGENGTPQTVDLSQYIDDTNLARILSGTVNSSTGIATFTRDDSSTFTVDFSSLNDQAGIAAAIAAHEAALDPHPQYTRTTTTSTDNAVAKYDGATGDIQDSNVFIDDSNNLGVGVDDPDHNIQVGERFNDTPAASNFQNTEIAQYSGTATNNGTAQLGLYESVPSSFPGDYGARIRYNAATNLLEFATVQGGVETLAFSFDRVIQTATFNGTVDGNGANQAKNFTDPTDDQDLMTKRYFDLRNDAVKVTNTTTGNLNTGESTFNNFTTTDQLGSGLGQFTFATNGVTPNFTGQVEITFNIELSGAATRACVGFRWSHNGSQGSWCRPTYLRNTSGHNETSANFSTIINVTSGQPIQIQHDNFAGGGTVTSPANGVEFTVKRIK